MKTPPHYIDFITDLFQVIGPVTAIRMFGGHGLFLEGLMFAIVDKSTLYLKTDDQTESLFIDKGMEKFSYQRQGKQCYLNYHQAPEEALEQLEQTRHWGNLAYQTALTTAAKSPKKARKN